MGRTHNGREPSPEEKENEAIARFMKSWRSQSQAFTKELEEAEMSLKKAQQRGKGPVGPPGDPGDTGEKGAEGDRGARGEEQPAVKLSRWETHSATPKSAAAKITNLTGAALMLSVTGISLTVTGYKSLVTGQLRQGNAFRFSNGMFKNETNAACVCTSGILNRILSGLKGLFADKTKTSVVTTRLTTISNNN